MRNMLTLPLLELRLWPLTAICAPLRPGRLVLLSSAPDAALGALRDVDDHLGDCPGRVTIGGRGRAPETN